MLTPDAPNRKPWSKDGKGWSYLQPQSEMPPFRHTCLKVLLQQIYKHRLAVPDQQLDVAEGWDDRLLDDICQQNPQYKCHLVYDKETSPIVLEGRARWAELHGYAAAYPDAPTVEDVRAAEDWLRGWRSRVPNYAGCKCRENFSAIEARNPFRLTSRLEFWRSTSENHNLVRDKLRQPRWEGSPPWE